MKEDSLKGNILDFSLDRDSIYFEDNIFSLRYINILNEYNGKTDENLINFIRTNSIKYLVIKNYNQIPKCIEINEIKETMRKISVRNFLKKIQKNKYKIVEIKDNKCI
jgi:disulfide oxidoreductase YuzD